MWLTDKLMLDYFPLVLLGFLGSFGHCIGMCGPITVAFALAQERADTQNVWRSLIFHSLLNLGRLASYTLVGAGIGAIGSVLMAGGQLAGIDSLLRQFVTSLTGIGLMWMGLVRVLPDGLPNLPIWHPFKQVKLHERLNAAMMSLSTRTTGLTPLLLGMTWGLIPCGFLYAAQIKAAATGNLWAGAVTMAAFGLGTLPAMLGIGISTTHLSRERRSQLFRLGGWVMLIIGISTLLRTSEMVDYTGHAALLLLALALVARPLSQVVPWLLAYRRGLGVGGFILAVAHTAHMLGHSFDWTLDALPYLLPAQQIGVWAGFAALVGMIPLALTSFDAAVKYLGHYWRKLHLLVLPAFLLVVAHTILLGSDYLGALDDSSIAPKLQTGMLLLGAVAVVTLRWRRIWSLFKLEKMYGSSRAIE